MSSIKRHLFQLLLLTSTSVRLSNVVSNYGNQYNTSKVNLTANDINYYYIPYLYHSRLLSEWWFSILNKIIVSSRRVKCANYIDSSKTTSCSGRNILQRRQQFSIASGSAGNTKRYGPSDRSFPIEIVHVPLDQLANSGSLTKTRGEVIKSIPFPFTFFLPLSSSFSQRNIFCDSSKLITPQRDRGDSNV